MKLRRVRKHVENSSLVGTLWDSATDANSSYKSERCWSVRFVPVAFPQSAKWDWGED